jgi:multidrug efflux pump
MNEQQINDYLSRVVQPKLQTLPGVAQAQILGGQKFAMRIWIDPRKLASLNLTVPDVTAALQNNNYRAAAGSTKGKYVAYDITVNTDVTDVETFKQLAIKNQNGTIIRIKDVANVELGPQSYDFSVTFDDQKAVFMGIFATPEANPLEVAKEVTRAFPEIQTQFPEGFTGRIIYNSTTYIHDSIEEVVRTIVEATLIVIVVIFLFLGAFRTVIIPVVTIPLCLVGVCSLILMMHYSINLMTLLAMVLAIGLVVDDAIVVVENVYRHLEEGKTPFASAIQGAREIAMPVITMTLTLVAVYAPIGFMSGITGTLFREFAFTLAMTVILSGVIALTLSPMMASKILTNQLTQARFVKRIDRIFEHVRQFYERRLTSVLNYRPVVVVFATLVFASCIFMALTSQRQLAPTEDQGFVLTIVNGPSSANLDYTQKYSAELNKIYQGFPSIEHYFILNGMPSINGAFSAAIMKPWRERSMSQSALQRALQEKEGNIAGIQALPLELPSIPGAGNSGFPVQFVLLTTNDYAQLYSWSQRLLEEAQKSGLFMFVQNDLSFDKPQLQLHIDRDKAAAVGVSMDQIAQSLSGLLSGNNINRFNMDGQSYEVIPQVAQADRFNPGDLNRIHVRTANGQLIPLGNLVSMQLASAPSQLNQFSQLNAATIGGMVMLGHTSDEALQFLIHKANQLLPQGYAYDYSGPSRQEKKEGNTLAVTFFFSLLVIYLVLAAQFESFRDPLIILVSVPMSICGALIFVSLGLSTLNIYTGIGLVTLIGLISKHGILIVDFANQLQTEGLSVRDAVIKAATIRLRPILMTTIAMVVGVLPLLIAKGPGAVSRFDIGLVIASGMLIGTCFTLFVLPTFYTFLARRHEKIIAVD